MDRTCDLQLRRLLLYPTELRAVLFRIKKIGASYRHRHWRADPGRAGPNESDSRRQANALVDGTFGVELGRHISAANQVHRATRLLQVGEQLPLWLLPGAQHHVVDRNQLFPVSYTHLTLPTIYSV